MSTTPEPSDPDLILRIDTRAQFDELFKQGASVTAGAPTELKFLIERKTARIYFLPRKFDFHFDFYKTALHGELDVSDFDDIAYNRPDRQFIAGTITAYDSYQDPVSGKLGQLCFSYWPTDRFDATLLQETHDALIGGLAFLPMGDDVAFRPGGPKQDRIVASEAAAIAAARIVVKTNLEISQGLKFMALSLGEALGRLVLIEKGAAMPRLGRGDVALFLGDVPATAPPVAALITTQIQTYNSHLGIKYRQDDIPYFYKAFSDDEVASLRALAGQPVLVRAKSNVGEISPAMQSQVDEYLASIRPQGRIRLTPNLKENKVRSFADLASTSVVNGRWSPAVMAAYGRKTLGVVQLALLSERGSLAVSEADEPEVVAPVEPMGVPASFYTRFMREAVDKEGQTLAAHLHAVVSDTRFASDEAWTADALDKLRKAINKVKMPAALLQELTTQLVRPYLDSHPGATKARLRSSAPVVEDSGGGVKLPNMAGAFDSHTAKWKIDDDPAKTLENAAEDMADTLQKVYASLFNDRAVAELTWNNVDMDEESVTMAVLVMPNEDDEKANGVVRVNNDLAGFFSITGETQLGENLVTNPELGATPDTWIDGNYDVLDGEARQDIEYERVTNQPLSDPARPHCYTDAEIHVVYKAMAVVRAHFAGLEGKEPKDYVDECETKVLADGRVQLKQERPWVE